MPSLHCSYHGTITACWYALNGTEKWGLNPLSSQNKKKYINHLFSLEGEPANILCHHLKYKL